MESDSERVFSPVVDAVSPAASDGRPLEGFFCQVARSRGGLHIEAERVLGRVAARPVVGGGRSRSEQFARIGV